MNKRTTLFGMLVISLTLLVPAASAQAAIDLAASARVDASGALQTVDDAKARAEGAIEAAKAEAQARAYATLEQTQAQAEASADAGADAGAGAMARLHEAFEGLASFASGIFARVQVDLRLG
jgi:regulator of protease activity HflC (stomatin/prohibitin superfamily)